MSKDYEKELLTKTIQQVEKCELHFKGVAEELTTFKRVLGQLKNFYAGLTGEEYISPNTLLEQKKIAVRQAYIDADRDQLIHELAFLHEGVKEDLTGLTNEEMTDKILSYRSDRAIASMYSILVQQGDIIVNQKS